MGPIRTIIGVDVGGTKTAAALLRARLPVAGERGAGRRHLQILQRITVASDVSSSEACVDSIVASITPLLAGSMRIEAVGLGVASMVDFAAGIAVHSVHLPLQDVPLRDLLAQRLRLPVVVDNDATVAALGEHRFGAGAGAAEMLMLTLGTGVGGGIICRGRPYRGWSGAGAEFGHMTIDVDGRECPGECPNRGCLEAYASGMAMAIAAEEAARAYPSSAFGRARQRGEHVDGALLSTLALAGDELAVAIVARIGEYLGAGLTTLVNAFNPQVIVIGGGAAASGELLLEPARQVVRERALPPARDEVRVVPALLGPDAGFIGAAALALVELLPEDEDPTARALGAS
jgi:glucokinase